MDDGGSRPSDWGRVDDIELTNILGTRAEIEALRAQQQDEDRHIAKKKNMDTINTHTKTHTLSCTVEQTARITEITY